MSERQRLAILGCTGSIGRSALEVVRSHPDRFTVTALAAFGSRADRLLDQVREFRPAVVAVADPAAVAAVESELPAGTELVSGRHALVDVAVRGDVDRVVAAVVGAAGLPPVHAALVAGKDVALANKESMVVAGRLLNEAAERSGAAILPVDSEHAALHQALRCGAAEEVRRLVLTASGGPFRSRELASWHQISPEEALAHPTWEMGAKITIDSATLMNKGLELIEASYLFGVPPDRIDVVVHPQSMVHSLVEYRDGSWLAQLSINDMALPIQYALSFPDRWPSSFERLDPAALGRLEFEPVDTDRFRTVDLARASLQAGESAPAVLNAANEVAVHAFLDRRIGFPRIVELVERVLEDHRPEPLADLEQALAWDGWARRRAAELLG